MGQIELIILSNMAYLLVYIVGGPQILSISEMEQIIRQLLLVAFIFISTHVSAY